MTDASIPPKATLRVAIVVQRCGENVRAGAESYALNLGKALARCGHTVDILTSRSDDYVHWNNVLPSKEIITLDKISARDGRHQQVRIMRFHVKQGRNRFIFAVVKRLIIFLQKFVPVFYRTVQPLLDWIFLRAQGPWCPGLWDHLRTSRQYDFVVFKSYLYAPAYFGIKANQHRSKSVFIVTAHSEPEFQFGFVGCNLERSHILGFVSEAEKQVCEKLWSIARCKLAVMVPPGLSQNVIEKIVPSSLSDRMKPIPSGYFLVVGRLDRNKNLQFIFDVCPPECHVVLAGDAKMAIPDDARFTYCGAVSEPDKLWLLKNAKALLMVSRFEAYSMITAEALALGCPVLALEGCGPVDELISRYGGMSVNEHEFVSWMKRLHFNSPFPESRLPNAELIIREKTWESTAEALVSAVSANTAQKVLK